MIYLDYNATSPYSPGVKQFIQGEMVEKWMNPSSEYIEGAELANEISAVRAEIAEYLDCSTRGLIFTSGATESINTVLSVGHLERLGVRRIVSSRMEHQATLDRLKHLEERGIEVQFIDNDGNGLLNLGHLEHLLAGEKSLVSLLFANNETGVINPVKEICELVHSKGHLVHIDAVQALGKIRFSLSDLDVDFASFSGHKIGSLKGVGLLYVQNIKTFAPLLHGGGQERGFRPGTMNFAAIKSLGLAVADTSKNDPAQLEELRGYLEHLLKKIPGVIINCESSPRLCNTVSIRLKQHNASEVLQQLTRQGIRVSTGSACSSGSFEPSHVMKALGLSKTDAQSCLRVSMGFLNSRSEIEILSRRLESIFAPSPIYTSTALSL
jgi:cysteine desulfurase